MRIPHAAWLAACLALSACGGGDGGGGAAPPVCLAGTACTPSSACSLGEIRCDASGPTCVATAPRPDGVECGEGATCSGGACLRTITVTGVERYVDDAGSVVTVPAFGFSESTFRALVLAANGCYQAFPGSATAPGVVEIRGVPAGPCLVERRHPVFTVPEFTEISGNVLDDSFDLLGRPRVGSTQATRRAPRHRARAVAGLDVSGRSVPDRLVEPRLGAGPLGPSHRRWRHRGQPPPLGRLERWRAALRWCSRRSRPGGPARGG